MQQFTTMGAHNNLGRKTGSLKGTKMQLLFMFILEEYKTVVIVVNKKSFASLLCAGINDLIMFVIRADKTTSHR